MTIQTLNHGTDAALNDFTPFLWHFHTREPFHPPPLTWPVNHRGGAVLMAGLVHISRDAVETGLAEKTDSSLTHALQYPDNPSKATHTGWLRLAYEPQLLIALLQIGTWKSYARKVETKRNFPKLLGATNLLKASFVCLKVASCTIFQSYRSLSGRHQGASDHLLGQTSYCLPLKNTKLTTGRLLLT